MLLLPEERIKFTANGITLTNMRVVHTVGNKQRHLFLESIEFIGVEQKKKDWTLLVGITIIIVAFALNWQLLIVASVPFITYFFATRKSYLSIVASNTGIFLNLYGLQSGTIDKIISEVVQERELRLAAIHL